MSAAGVGLLVSLGLVLFAAGMVTGALMAAIWELSHGDES